MRDEFLITRQGRQHVLFAGLLDAAHARGLRGIETDLLQVPNADNGGVAIVKARVELEDGRAFTGIGDASPENVGRNIAPHVIRMAETRAKARALRDAVDVGASILEELAEDPVSPQTAGQAPDEARPRNDNSNNVSTLQGRAPNGGARGRGRQAGARKARKSQVELLRTLAEELRGENGVERLETAMGKSLRELTVDEANLWIDRLTPAEQGSSGGGA